MSSSAFGPEHLFYSENAELSRQTIIVYKLQRMKPKRRMQNVRFRNIDEMLSYLPDDELEILERLREIVLASIPNLTERLSYNVPYYRRHKDICFIWPGSVSWGSQTQEGVRFGFTQGFLIPDETRFLEKGNRKQVYWHDFHVPGDIDENLLTNLLMSAADIDDQLHHERRYKR